MIDELIARQIVRRLSNGPQRFSEIVPFCWGAFPSDVRRVLVDLVNQTTVLQRGEQFGIAPIPGTPLHGFGVRPSDEIARRYCEIVRDWPDPHQSNYEWRFTFEGARLLLDTVQSLCGSAARVCFMGCPTPFLFAALAGLSESILLLDNGTPTISYMRTVGFGAQVREHDLLLGLPSELSSGFDAVVMDPPWYPEYYANFLDASSRAVVKGGYVLSALFPPCTREAAADERATVLQAGFECGLSVVSLCQGVLRYDTPHFEANTLALSGVEPLPNWRQADLLVFVKTAEPGGLRPAVVRPSSWKEWILGKCVVKLRVTTERFDNCEILVPIRGQNALLPTVSRTCELIPHIGLWTSSNHAYRVNRPDLVGRILDLMSRGMNAAEVKLAIQMEFSQGSHEDQQSLCSAVDELFKATCFV